MMLEIDVARLRPAPAPGRPADRQSPLTASIRRVSPRRAPGEAPTRRRQLRSVRSRHRRARSAPSPVFAGRCPRRGPVAWPRAICSRRCRKASLGPAPAGACTAARLQAPRRTSPPSGLEQTLRSPPAGGRRRAPRARAGGRRSRMPPRPQRSRPAAHRRCEDLAPPYPLIAVSLGFVTPTAVLCGESPAGRPLTPGCAGQAAASAGAGATSAGAGGTSAGAGGTSAGAAATSAGAGGTSAGADGTSA